MWQVILLEGAPRQVNTPRGVVHLFPGTARLIEELDVIEAIKSSGLQASIADLRTAKVARKASKLTVAERAPEKPVENPVEKPVESEPPLAVPKAEQPTPGFLCSECSQTFTSEQKLKAHKRKVHKRK